MTAIVCDPIAKPMTHVLNQEQRAAFASVQRGKTIFITGAGGTGKSFLIDKIVQWAKEHKKVISVTAMTGCAAFLLYSLYEDTKEETEKKPIKATTLHSWAGVGLAQNPIQELISLLAKKRKAQCRWKKTEILIIDEVSMLTEEFLLKLDAIGKHVRKRPAQFMGGIQVIFLGDFCQLPPVTKGSPAFVFHCDIWKKEVKETYELVQNERQHEEQFQHILQEARFGSLSSESIAILKQRIGLPWKEKEIRPTLLLSRRCSVDSINKLNLDALVGEEHIYEVTTVTTALFHGNLLDGELHRAIEKLDKEASYETTLRLKTGAQVMHITNNPLKELVNGSRGVIMGFTFGGYPIVRFFHRDEPIVIERTTWSIPDVGGVERSQLPLIIAYAITIHKSQGSTLDTALIDIGTDTFEYGQAYVALSRVRSLEGLYIWKMDPSKIRCHPAVRSYYETLRRAHSLSSFIYTPTLSETKEKETEDKETEEKKEEKEEKESQREADLFEKALCSLNSSHFWKPLFETFLQSSAGVHLQEKLKLFPIDTITPPPEDIFTIFQYFEDPSSVKVLILGQDPYPTKGMAHGLAFSVRPEVTKLPPSLANMYKEMTADIGNKPTSGCLLPWVRQGVFLFNTILTTIVGVPFGHKSMGWETWTDQVLRCILESAPHIVILAWGRAAQTKIHQKEFAACVSKHTILEAPHPSPLSAHTGFFGARPFSRANEALRLHGQTEIDWLF
jgi:ATP-dependent DNA helicase PIF1